MFLAPSSSRAVDPYLQILLLRVSLSRLGGKHRHIKHKSIMHEPSPSYTTDYMVTMDHNGKIMVKYVGAYTKKKILRSVWLPNMYPSNLQGPKSIWIPKFQV